MTPPERVAPPRLQHGDTVGIISPSWGGGAAYPHRVERGIAHLQTLGFTVKVGRYALNERGAVSDTPEHRVQDIHDLFGDPDVKAIIATIGGDHSCHLLPLLDWDLIRANPKIFMGFSDVTVLNVALWTMTGLVTFNGPSLMTEFADYPRMPPYSERYVVKTLCDAAPVGPIEPSDWWTDEFLDWGTRQDLTRARARHPTTGWTWLKPGRADGRLLGGCLESLEHLRGTRYWPAWDGAILFLETSEEKPSPSRVDAMLMDYENMGIFAQLRGLLVGRPMSYTPEERAELRQVIQDRTKNYAFPVIADMDFGHTSPMFTLPLGCQATIDTAQQRFAIIDAAVS